MMGYQNLYLGRYIFMEINSRSEKRLSCTLSTLFIDGFFMVTWYEYLTYVNRLYHFIIFEILSIHEHQGVWITAYKFLNLYVKKYELRIKFSTNVMSTFPCLTCEELSVSMNIVSLWDNIYFPRTDDFLFNGCSFQGIP